jgi:hypothetical protein
VSAPGLQCTPSVGVYRNTGLMIVVNEAILKRGTKSDQLSLAQARIILAALSPVTKNSLQNTLPPHTDFDELLDRNFVRRAEDEGDRPILWWDHNWVRAYEFMETVRAERRLASHPASSSGTRKLKARGAHSDYARQEKQARFPECSSPTGCH